jgi:hypothetical protein
MIAMRGQQRRVTMVRANVDAAMSLSRFAPVILLVASVSAGCTRVPLDPAVGHASLSCVAPPVKAKPLAGKSTGRTPISSRRGESDGAEFNTKAPTEVNTTAALTIEEPPEVERARHIADLEARFRRWDEAAKRAITSVCEGCLR